MSIASLRAAFLCLLKRFNCLLLKPCGVGGYEVRPSDSVTLAVGEEGKSGVDGTLGVEGILGLE